MFGFGKKKKDISIEKKFDQEMLNKAIFSADEAKQMGIEAKDKKRNDNRREIFRQVKVSIQAGQSSMNLPTYLFVDNNDTYFEGLGYKVKKIWIDMAGVTHYEEPTEQANPTIPPTSGSNWGGAVIQQYYYRPQPLIQLKWE